MTDSQEAAAMAALAYVQTHPGTSFVELERVMSEFFPVEGDLAIGMEQRNVVLWSGISEDFADVYAALDGKITLEPASWLVYLADGKALNLPLVKRLPKKSYKKPHWLPVVFNVSQVVGP